MATEVGQLTLKVDTSDVGRAASQVENLGDKAQKTEQQTGKLAKTSARSNVVMGNFGRQAGMAGIQFEQLAGQIAAGQNPMRAIGVQAADLGFILGVPLLGAVVGIGAALGSVLIPMLMDTEKSTEDLEKSISDISKLMSESASTSALVLSDSFMKLAKSSRDLAELQLRVSLFDAITNVTAAQTALLENTEDLVVAQYRSGHAARNNEGRLNRFAASMGISSEAAMSLRENILDMRNGVDGAADSLVTLINGLFATGQTTEKFNELIGPVLQTALTLKTAEEQAAFLTEALANLDGALAEGEESSSSFAQTTEGTIAALERELATLEQGALAIMLQDEARKGASPEQLAEIERIYELVEAKKAEIAETRRAAAEKEREAEAAKRQAEAKAEAEKRAAQAAAERRERDALSAAESLATEEEAIMLSYQRRHDAIMASTQMTEEMKRDLIARLDAETNQKLLESNQSYWDQWLTQQQEAMTTFDDVATSALNTFKQAAGSAFERIIFDSESAEDAVKNFAEAMGRSVINALGQMAAEWAAYYIVQSLMGKTAQAGAATAMTANAAATSAQAGLAAFASTAAIPIVGPALAPGAAAAAIAATTPFVTAIAALSSAAIAGRALGGQVRAGESYIVGERGPELLTMGAGGRITPNEMLRGQSRSAPAEKGKTELNVQVQNYGSSEISVQRISETDVRIIAREVAAQTVREQAPGVVASDINNPNGRVSKSLSNNVIAQRRR
jgi:hypothetical protein